MIHKSYKYRIYPNKTQQVKLNKTFGCTRFIWNKNVESFNNHSEFRSSTEYRKEYEFLQEISAGALQQKEIDFKDFKNQFFNKSRKKKLGKPNFKNKKQKQSFRLPNRKFYIEEENSRIYLEKIGKVKIKLDKSFTGKTLSVTISKDKCNDYFVSILVEQEVKSLEKTNKSVGIDVGIKSLITTSDGLQVNHFPDNQRKIKKLQKKLSRKKVNSNRFNYLKLKITRLHRKEARRREWILHNISKYLVENYDQIIIEDLNIAGMMKNHKLAGSIGRSCWSELTRQLNYKCNWYGKELIKINRFFPSSKTCSGCGHVKDQLGLDERTYICESCGLVIDRDLNASISIRSVGITTDVNQSVMECKTCLNDLSFKQAIPSDLIKFLQ